ncbi:conjugation protein [Bacillus paralicheniformis]|nr:conjugation protein [Bacillus paralicheniformis]
MDKSSSESVRERALLMPDELMKLKEGESIVVRANKRQDNKFNKIVPKPIFNRGKTAAKARYEYLSDDFDNSKSVLNLPIVSDHQNIDLSEIVFTADQDCYKKLIDLVGKQTVIEFKQIFRKNLGIVQDNNVERCLQIVDSHFEEFTAQQFFSFIVFEAPLSAKHVNLMIDELTGTLPVSDLEKWRHYAKRKEQIEEDESDRWAAIASGEEELY